MFLSSYNNLVVAALWLMEVEDDYYDTGPDPSIHHSGLRLPEVVVEDYDADDETVSSMMAAGLTDTLPGTPF